MVLVQNLLWDCSSDIRHSCSQLNVWDWTICFQDCSVALLMILCWLLPRSFSSLSCESEVAQSYPTLYDPTDCSLPGRRIGMGCYFLLQGIFPTQGSKLGLPHCRQTLYCLSQEGSLSCEALYKYSESLQQEAGFTIHSETAKKKKSKIYETIVLRHLISDSEREWSLREGKQIKWSYNFSSFLPKEFGGNNTGSKKPKKRLGISWSWREKTGKPEGPRI